MEMTHDKKGTGLIRSILKMMKFYKRYWILGILIFILMGVGIFFNIGIAYVSEQSLNLIELDNQSAYNQLLRMALIIGMISLILIFIQGYITNMTWFLITRDLAFELFNKIHKFPLIKMISYHTGDLIARVRGDSAQAVGIIGRSAYDLIFNVLMAVSAFTYLSTVSWPLALLVVITGPVSLFVGRIFDKKIRKLSTKQQEKDAEVKGFLQEFLQGMTTIRAFGLGDLMSEKYGDKRLSFNKVSLERTHTNQKMRAIIGLSNRLVFLVVFFTVTLLTFRGTLEIGALIAFFILMNRIQMPFQALSSTWGELQASYGATNRVNAILDEDIPENPTTFSAQHQDKLLELKNISFTYPLREGESINIAVKNISLTINHGDKIAIVGASGAGKTTLAKMICGLYTPDEGEIELYGGQENTQGSPLTDAISYVPQQAYLFSGTILENISFSNRSASKEEIIDSAKSAQIHEDIMQLENGYDTIVAEKGSTLSGGQRQRITIARAFLKDSPLLVLDEATSAVDVLNESRVYQAMDQLMADKTVVVIAHRLSTIKKMDRIIVLDHGMIVEEGNHEELISLQGYYYQLNQN